MPDSTVIVGGDLATGSLSLGAVTRDGREYFASVGMRGATEWREQPAFDLNELPGMLLEALAALRAQGLALEPGSGSISFGVRQHDQVLLDEHAEMLTPALSWQCIAASEQVQRLRQLGLETIVGRIEERFILPKLMWTLETEPYLRQRLHRVMTTGDWISFMLTGEMRLSTSDALSNGLLDQREKTLAAEVMEAVGVHPGWFPGVIASGTPWGVVSAARGGSAWREVQEALRGWQVVAPIADNHATGVGCGLSDYDTIVVSAGNSGTVNRLCAPDATPKGGAANFGYYDDRLLLMMLADCCIWYDRFAEQYGGGASLASLDDAALRADLEGLLRVLHSDEEHRESYPDGWEAIDLPAKVASTQFSILLELMLLVQAMQAELPGSEVRRYVLTGGLSQSLLFQQLFRAGARLLNPRAEVMRSARTGPMRYKTTAAGALINADLPNAEGRDLRARLESLMQRWCPLTDCAAAAPAVEANMQRLLSRHGL